MKRLLITYNRLNILIYYSAAAVYSILGFLNSFYHVSFMLTYVLLSCKSNYITYDY